MCAILVNQAAAYTVTQAFLFHFSISPSLTASQSDPRFMIDISTYNQMHSGPSEKSSHHPSDDDLGPDVMSRDEPPEEDDFLLCLPNTIPGFNMNKKEWSSNPALCILCSADFHFS